jgi:hypothetical protein
MNVPPSPDLTIGVAFPWLTMALDQTEKVAAIIPEEKLDWRLNDPSGKWHFSLAEIAMHCADARRLFARMMSGLDRTEDYLSPGPGEDGVWPFRPYGSKQAVLDELAAARLELEPWLLQPASAAMEVTDPAQATWEKNLARMREKGMDTALDELRGPASILRVLMACAVHEAGHRSSLQTLLRMHGVNLG